MGSLLIYLMVITFLPLLRFLTALSMNWKVFWISVANYSVFWFSVLEVSFPDFKHSKKISEILFSLPNNEWTDSVCYGLYVFSISSKHPIVDGFLAKFLIIDR